MALGITPPAGCVLSCSLHPRYSLPTVQYTFPASVLSVPGAQCSVCSDHAGGLQTPPAQLFLSALLISLHLQAALPLGDVWLFFLWDQQSPLSVSLGALKSRVEASLGGGGTGIWFYFTVWGSKTFCAVTTFSAVCALSWGPVPHPRGGPHPRPVSHTPFSFRGQLTVFHSEVPQSNTSLGFQNGGFS